MLGRLGEQMRAAEAAGEAALAGLNATIAARVAEAEAAAARARRRRPAADEAPLARLAERIAANVAEAERAAARAAETASQRFNAGLEAAEAAGERLRSGLTEALTAAEESYGQLAARAEAQREAAMEPFAVAGMPNFEAVEAVTEGLSEARRHMLGFISGRIRQALETQAELMACRNLAEMRAVQQQYMRAAVSEYVAEAGSLARLGGDVAARAMPRVGRR